MAGNQTSLRFTAVAGRTYSVLYRDDLSNGTWLRLQNVPGQAATGPFDVTDSGAGGSYFFVSSSSNRSSARGSCDCPSQNSAFFRISGSLLVL